MCTAKTPKINKVEDDGPTEYLRNRYLDGRAASNAVGRNSLRIGRGSNKTPLTLQGRNKPAEPEVPRYDRLPAPVNQTQRTQRVAGGSPPGVRYVIK